MTRSLRLVACAVLVHALFANGLIAQDQAAGAKPQPPVEKAGAAAKPADTPDAPAPSQPTDALLSSPDAREVPRTTCVAPDTGCPLTTAQVAAMSNGLIGPLQKADGTDSALSAEVKELLAQSYKDTPLWDKRAPAVAVHLVDESTPGKVRDRWLLATRAGKNIDLSEGRRIYGAKTIGLVYVHFNIMAVSPAAAADAFSDLSYRVVIKKKIPDNINNLLALLKFAVAQGQAGVTAVPVSLLGFGTVTGVGVPSDVTFFGVRTGVNKLAGSAVQFDNEGKYWWDMSVAVPVTKLSMLDYSQDTNTVVPKQINKQSVYATFNLFPVPVDTKSGNTRFFVPRVILGIGLTGRPGENVLVGGAWGFQYLQFFAGAAFANQNVPAGSTPPASGADLTQKYKSSFAFGLNVPVVSALKQLTSSSNAAASGDTASGKAKAAAGGK
jgi:hypothetical protein